MIEITEEFGDYKGLDYLSGVYVADVFQGGAAQKAGIKKDDIILSVNGLTVDTRAQLMGVLGQYRPGDVVDVKIKRGEKEKTIKVTLTSYPQ